jgi:hypothetical protein
MGESGKSETATNGRVFWYARAEGNGGYVVARSPGGKGQAAPASVVTELREAVAVAQKKASEGYIAYVPFRVTIRAKSGQTTLAMHMPRQSRQHVPGTVLSAETLAAIQKLL